MIVYPFSFLQTVSTGDADATAYLAAVVATGGTVDGTITAAVNTLFTDLKTAGIYSKLDLLMPMVGGTKASCLINGIYPTNNTWKWTEYGTTLTYNISGITGNNNGALKSNFLMSDLTQATSGSSHFSVYYNKLSTVGTGPYFNGYINTNQNPYGYFNTTVWYGSLYGGMWGSTQLGASHTMVTGLFLRTRTASNFVGQYANNTLVQSSTAVPTVFATDYTQNIGLLALAWQSQPNGLYNETGNPTIATVTLGSGLNSTERTSLNTIITAFNTALSRN
jgi:hypothetical protein